MPRKAAQQAPMQTELNTGALAQASTALTVQSEAARRLMQAYNVTHANPDALETEIRGYQQTAVEAMFAIGARLLLLRTISEHGDWLKRLERLSMAPRAAQRVMQATLRFADPTKPRDKLLGLGQGKLIELITLDDEELDELEAGGNVLELNLDDVSKMSTTELRRAVREARGQAQAKDKLLDKRAKEIDTLKERDAFKPRPDSVAQDETEQRQYLALQQAHAEALASFAKLSVVVRDILGNPDGVAGAMSTAAEGAVQHLAHRMVDICTEHDIRIDLDDAGTPDWMKPAEPAAPAQATKATRSRKA